MTDTEKLDELLKMLDEAYESTQFVRERILRKDVSIDGNTLAVPDLEELTLLRDLHVAYSRFVTMADVMSVLSGTPSLEIQNEVIMRYEATTRTGGSWS